MARKTKEDALATRELILDAAERVFHQRGVSRTSLQEIAKDAGLTRGAIYWHFENKGELFHAMMERVTLPMMARMTEITPDDEERPLDKIRRNTAAALHQIAHNPAGAPGVRDCHAEGGVCGRAAEHARTPYCRAQRLH